MNNRQNPVFLLNRLLADFVYLESDEKLSISGLETDSRRIQSGDLFVACSVCGANADAYVRSAINQGAVAVLFEVENKAQHGQLLNDYSVPVIGFYQLSDLAGSIAARFYSNPSASMQVIGITGTNGKTSCTQLIAQALTQQGSVCGVIGTLGSGLWGALQHTGFTTPQAVELQRNLFHMTGEAAAVAVEVSSHALDQGRVNGVEFDIAVLTNLSRDHLDYHGDMAAYRSAKARLFQWPGLGAAVVNLDDELGVRLFAESTARACFGYRLVAQLPREVEENVVYAQVVARDLTGVQLSIASPWGGFEMKSPLLGQFNVANLMAVFIVLMIQGFTLEQARASLEKVKPPAGRMECFKQPGRPLAVIDYAHTPDALAQVLETLRAHCEGSLWVVFGCGGDRDRGKRSEMGKAAAEFADQIVLTNDNPRTESPESIVADIIQGIADQSRVSVSLDRQQAIDKAISAAGEYDVLLIAGKGHEDYQIIGEQRMAFSDRQVVQNFYTEAA